MNKKTVSTNTSNANFTEISGELLELLAQIGYMGINQGFTSEAQTIFDALTAVRPNNKDALLLQSTAYLFLGKIKEGTKGLIEILKKDPSNDLAKSFLALAFKMGKADDYAKSAAQAVLDESKDVAAQELAEALIDFYNTQAKNSVPSLRELTASQAKKTSRVK